MDTPARTPIEPGGLRCEDCGAKLRVIYRKRRHGVHVRLLECTACKARYLSDERIRQKVH